MRRGFVMFSPELLGEVVIVGLMLIIAACLPFLLFWSPTSIKGLFVKTDKLNSTGVAAVLMLILTYSVGLAGSLVANDIAIDKVREICPPYSENPPEEKSGLTGWLESAFGLSQKQCHLLLEPDARIKDWITYDNPTLRNLKQICSTPTPTTSSNTSATLTPTSTSGSNDPNCVMYNHWAIEGEQWGDYIKIAETALKERDETIRARLDREKSYARICQGAALACALLLIVTPLTFIIARVYGYLRDTREVCNEKGTNHINPEEVPRKTLSERLLDWFESLQKNSTRKVLAWRVYWLRKSLKLFLGLLFVGGGILAMTLSSSEYFETERKYGELVVHLYGGLAPKGAVDNKAQAQPAPSPVPTP
jgi:hypothetical protein